MSNNEIPDNSDFDSLSSEFHIPKIKVMTAESLGGAALGSELGEGMPDVRQKSHTQPDGIDQVSRSLAGEQAMELEQTATEDNVSQITSARSYRERIAQEKNRQIEANREDFRQHYPEYIEHLEHPEPEKNKKLDEIAVRGMYVIYGEKK
jgi:hypothetical protein